jgi:hypothetical protein
MITFDSKPNAEILNSLPDIDQQTPADILAKIEQLGTELYDLQSEIEQLEERIAEKKKLFTRISQNDLVALFVEARVDTIGLPDRNTDIVLAPWVNAKIPEDKKDEAFNWLTENGHGGIIKTEVSISLGKDSVETAKEIADYLRMRYQEYETTLEQKVHAATLTSFIKGQLQEGIVVPLELLGASAGSVVKFKKRKQR